MVGADEQKAMSRETWAAMQEAGAQAGAPLEVETFFFAPTEPVAQALSADLASDGWRAEVSSTKQGLIRRRVVWAVVATRLVEAAGAETFEDMVDRLDALASRHGAEFDGWGAEID